jgi:DNA-directed RNA polymerase subunit M/transcription elongation factor TFIIS
MKNNNMKKKNMKKNNKKIDYTSPYNKIKYDFIIKNSNDLHESWIRHAELNIDRAVSQIKLNKLLFDIDIAIKIEFSIFEYSLIYCLNNKFDKNYIKSIYDDKFNFIYSNLNEKDKIINNKDFKLNILNGLINPSQVAFFSPQQIHPKKWSKILNKKELVEQRENNIVYSDAYKCYKCGYSKSKISQFQTRSADEPLTTFVFCLVCHNTFKFS